jgi:hypothetical protein
MAAGALTIQVRRPASDQGAGVGELTDGHEVVFTAHVVREGMLSSAGFGGVRQTVDVESEEIVSEGHVLKVVTGVRISIYGKESASLSMPVYRYGRRLLLVAKLRPPRNFRNPGAFDYRGYLADHDITLLGSAKVESCSVLPGFYGSRLEHW